MNNVLIIGAHSDDCEISCSGAAALHAIQGDNVHMVVMTSSKSIDGTTTKVLRTIKQLHEETEKSRKLIGCKSLDFLPFTDLNLPFNFESVSRLDSLIKTYNIDTIYTHYEYDSNQDHIAACKITMAAARYVPNVYCYPQIPIPRLYTRHFAPNYYVDITDTFETKLAASRCHVSQMKKYKAIGFDVIKNLTVAAEFYGLSCNVKYAEAFYIVKQVNYGNR